MVMFINDACFDASAGDFLINRNSSILPVVIAITLACFRDIKGPYKIRTAVLIQSLQPISKELINYL